MQDQTISLGPRHVDSVISHRQVQPSVVPDDDAVGAMQPHLVLLRRQPQTIQQVATLIRHAVAVGVPQRREQRRVHHEHRAGVKGQSLDGIEAAGKESRFVGIAIAVAVGEESNFVMADDRDSQTGHIIVGDENRARPRTDRDDRRVFHQRIAGEQSRPKTGRDNQRRKAAFRLRPASRRGLCGATVGAAGQRHNESGQNAERTADAVVFHEGDTEITLTVLFVVRSFRRNFLNEAPATYR